MREVAGVGDAAAGRWRRKSRSATGGDGAARPGLAGLEDGRPGRVAAGARMAGRGKGVAGSEGRRDEGRAREAREGRPVTDRSGERRRPAAWRGGGGVGEQAPGGIEQER